LSALGAAGISEPDINHAASRMLYGLTNQRAREWAKEHGNEHHSDPLKIANAVFVGNNVTLNTRFAQTFLDYYRGNVIQVDFLSDQAVEAVNQWASDNTDGLIPEIIQAFDPRTVAAVANAIYFSDRWEWEFRPEETREAVFHSPAGEQNAFYMLREGNNQVYYEDDRVQATPLRFRTGCGLYIILPKDGDATGLLSSMTSEYFEEIQRDSINASGKLLLPRFTMDSGVLDLKDCLVSLGVPLFDPLAAPLTGGLLEEDIPVWLESAVHKAVIEVDEKGTTAAAVTVMAAAGSGMPLPTEPFEMICDSPFVFVLYGYTFDGGYQVLFTGVVNQP
jgi:serpin B